MKATERSTKFELTIKGERIDLHVTERPLGTTDPLLSIRGTHSAYFDMRYSALQELYYEVARLLGR